MYALKKANGEYQVGHYEPLSNGQENWHVFVICATSTKVDSAMRLVNYLNGGESMTQWPDDLAFV